MAEKEPLQWQAFEYGHRERSADWFWVLGIVALTSVVVFMILGNILFALLIIIAALLLALFAVRKPNVVFFEINERGIAANNTVYPYAALDSFCVHNPGEDRQPKLFLKSQKMLMPHVSIPLEGPSPEEVRTYLIEYIEEEDIPEPLPEKIISYFNL
jgi:hypothetical protein